MKKKLTKTLIALSVAGLAGNAMANEEFTNLSNELGIWAIAPVAALSCAVNGDTSSQCNIAYAVGIPIGISTTSVLLRKVKAARPDALAYAAGQNSSLLLDSVVADLQDIAYEMNGVEFSYEEIVNDIITNI